MRHHNEMLIASLLVGVATVYATDRSLKKQSVLFTLLRRICFEFEHRHSVVRLNNVIIAANDRILGQFTCMQSAIQSLQFVLARTNNTLPTNAITEISFQNNLLHILLLPAYLSACQYVRLPFCMCVSWCLYACLSGCLSGCLPATHVPQLVYSTSI